MRPGSAVICPSCGTRNKPKWEYCVSCGESLRDVPATDAKSPAPSAAVEARGGFPWLTTLLLLIGSGVALAYWLPRQSEPLQPDPAIFAAPTASRPAEAPAVPVAIAPSEAPSLALLRDAELALNRGDAAAALPLLAQAVASLPGNPKAHHLYAVALWQTGSREQALDQYRAAVSADPLSRVYRTDLAKGLASLGRRDEAMAEYESLLDVSPESPGALRELAALHAQAGNRERWVELLTRAVELDPRSAVLRQEQAYALEKSGRTAEAIEAYRSVVELEPKAAATRGLLADLLFRQGQRDEAIALVREGVELDPNAARPHRDLGMLLELSGRVPEAVAEYREYARLAPTSPDARQLAARAERLARLSGGGS